MKKRFASLGLLAAALTLSYASTAGSYETIQGAKPMFAHPPAWPAMSYPKGHKPAGQLPQWNGGFTDLTGHSITFTMAGADPSTSNATTHVKMIIIPVVFVYGASNGNMTFNPKIATLNGSKNIIKSLVSSPICDNGADFQSGPIDMGQGQYLDEYQRANFWGHVSTNTSYHTVLDCAAKTKGLKPLKIVVTPTQGKVITNPFGSGVVGTYPINSFDTAVHSYLTAHNTIITPDTFPLFISYDIYLTSGGCCIGGYHSAVGHQPAGQTYGYTTIVDSAGAFSEDIDAASHEVGEWMDDSFTDNHVNCQDNSIMENGDPLEGLTNYGTFTVALNGFTWHPQSLVMQPYFGAPTSTSANGWVALHNDITNVCPGQ